MPFIGKSIAAALAVVAATASIVSAADRQAERGIASDWLPAAFAGPALLGQAAQRSVAAGDLPRAASFARRAIMLAPNEAHWLGLFGSIEQGLGHERAADEAFRIAGSLGWRDFRTQYQLASEAYAQGADKIAAQRVDAILRVDPANPILGSVLGQFETSGDFRQALADRLALSPVWADAYLKSMITADESELAPRLAIIARARKLGLTVQQPVLVQTIGALFSINRDDQAARLWYILGQNAANPLRESGDPGFDHLDATEQPSAFSWTLGAQEGLDVHPVAAHARLSGTALSIQSSVIGTVPAASQYLALLPGRYAIRWHMVRDDGSRDTASISVRVLCRRSGAPLTIAMRSRGAAFLGTFDTRERPSCDAQLLQIVTGRLEGAPTLVDDFSVKGL